MEKRKLKLNVLDFAIFAVIICAVAVLIFRDVIHDAVGKPEIVELCVTVELNDKVPATLENAESTTLNLDIDSDSNSDVTVLVDDVMYKTAVVRFNGFKRLGRYYSESGDLIKPTEACSISFDEAYYDATVKSVEIVVE